MAAACAMGWAVSLLTTTHGLKSMLHAAHGDSEKLAELINQKEDLDAEQAAHWIRQADQIMMLMAMQQSQTTIDELTENQAAAEEYDDKELKTPLPMLEKLISEAGKVDASERMLLLNLTRGFYADEAGAAEALKNLQQSSAMDPPVRFANEFYADVLVHSPQDKQAEALQHYLRESEFFDQAAYARQQAMQIMIVNKDRQGLEKISDQSQYMDNLDAHSRMEIATILNDWLSLARAVIQLDYERSTAVRYLISLFAGAIWLIIIGQFAGFGKRQLILYSAALLLGIMSASTTLFVVVIQDNVRGFTLEGDMWHQLTYCIAGIGLREESIKLLFFVPLIPFLKRRPEIEGLVVASFVGLGFAIQENVGYFLGESFSPWSRFFSANFFHMAITGILGLALLQFARWPRTRWEELLATFLAAVVIHGLYDALLMIPELSSDFGIFTLLILSVIAYRYFDLAEHLANTGRSRILSPLGVFVLGAALLGGVVMVFSCWGMPFRLALMGFLGSGLTVFPVVFIFINRFRDA